MRPAELAAVLEGTSCSARAVAEHGFHAATCPSADDKLVILERLADRDVKRDPRVRRLALELLRGVPRGPDGRHRPELVARRLHAHVRDTVPYVGEGVETFQPTWTTLKYGGDCDDSARALLALARSVGVPARFETLERCRRGKCHKTHVAAQLWDGSAWQWAETTIKAELGEHPRGALVRLKASGRYPANRADLNGLAPLAFGSIPDGSSCKAPSQPEIDKAARATIVDAWGLMALTLPQASPAAMQFSQAVCRFETYYGRGWAKAAQPPALVGSHNWGSVHGPGKTHDFGKTKPTVDEVAATGIDCGPQGALGFDRKPNGVYFAVCFRTYVDDVGGASDVLKHLYKGKAQGGGHPVADLVNAGSTDARALCAAMFDQGYFGGVGTREKAIEDYATAVESNACAISKALGEPHMIRRGGSSSTGRALPWLLGAVAVAGATGGGYYLWKRGRRRVRRR